MCGICGIYRGPGKPVLIQELREMTNMMVHRGPDDEGFRVEDGIGFGFRRLAIVDVLHGHQPLLNEDNSVSVVCNGEIYNYQSLRRELLARGHTFRTESDIEVIVHLYEDHGIDAVRLLEGMFSAAIFDSRTKELFLVRDPFGIKPLYYTQSGEGIRFSSEMRALRSTIDFKIDEQSMWDYFTLQYIPSSQSVVEGIHKLPPAHYMRCHNHSVEIHQYFTPEYRPENKPLSYFVEGILHHLRESVKRHLQGDVKIGAFLSSGVDSATLAALAKESRDIQTFSVGFTDATAQMDELAVAGRTAMALGIENERLTLTAEDVMQHLPEVLYSLEEPLGDPSAFPLYFLSQMARRHVKVVLSGEGADECFGGYPIYHEPHSLKMFQHLPGWCSSFLREVATILPHGVKGKGFLLRGTTPIERRFLGNIHVFHEDVKHCLLESRALPVEPLPTFRITDPIYRRTRALDDVTRMQVVDLCTWLPGDILLKADKMSMAHSLELRVPFLDMNLFQFASTIPTEYRVAGSHSKFALRQAVRGLLPNEVVHRPKLGFPVPYRKWLRESMNELVWDVFCSSKIRHYFSKSYVESMLTAHRTGQRDFGRELWTLLTFLLWHQVYDETRRTAAS